ncbi:MAG TPA: flagellar basal body-associated FliL family protein [Microthrixaceae bacterium]|nr:flagellar basal body-associated FliL family protein [Microthrixaceae bacterium]
MSATETVDAPAEEEHEVEAAPEPADKKRRSNLVPALVLAVGMVAAAFLLRPAGGAGAGAVAAPSTTEPAGPTIALEPLTLNLADDRFLRIGVAIELGESVDVASFEQQGSANRLKDLIIFEVADLTAKQLSSPAGLESLKSTLTEGAEELYGDDFHRLYLTDLVIQ